MDSPRFTGVYIAVGLYALNTVAWSWAFAQLLTH